MAIETVRYIRKPLYVEAVRITAANFDEVAEWAQGEILQDEIPGKGTTKKYIQVSVHNPKNIRQTKAFVGDWLLYTERGYKVYTNKAFHSAFDKVSEQTPADLEAAKHGIVMGSQEIAPGITLTQAVQELRTAQPTTLDQIRQLQNAGYSDEQIAAQLGLAVEVIKVIENDGRTPQPTPSVPRSQATNVEDVPAQETIVPAAAEGKRVLSIEEQKYLTADEVREMVKAGDAVLAQDIPEG